MRLQTERPPSGGCVLKLPNHGQMPLLRFQPPSGGCVLKPELALMADRFTYSRLQAAVC